MEKSPDPAISNLKNRNSSFNVTYAAEVFVDPPGKYGIRELLREESGGEVNFVSLLEQNLGISRKTYWFKLKFPPSAGDFPWDKNSDYILEFRCPYVNELDIYLVPVGTEIIEEKHSLGRTQMSAVDVPPPHRNPTVSFTLPRPKKRIYIFAQNLQITSMLGSFSILLRNLLTKQRLAYLERQSSMELLSL